MPDDRPEGLLNTSPRGGEPFVWVEDDDTKARYDVPRYAILPGMTPVEGYDLNWSDQPRATKYPTAKDGQPVRVDEPSGDALQARKAAADNAKRASQEPSS